MGNEIYFGWIDLVRDHDAPTRATLMKKLFQYVVSINVEVNGVPTELANELEQLPGVNVKLDIKEVVE